MKKFNLVLIHRGSEYERDFKEIADKIVAIDPSIAVHCIDPRATNVMRDEDWQRPSLTVALLAKFKAVLRRGHVLTNRAIHKTGQHHIFTKSGLPTPPTQRLTLGTKLDPIMFGEYVVIKPTNPNLASYGRGIQLFRRKRLENMMISDFPRDHLIHRDLNGFIVQRFIDTGPYLRMYRILTLFGVPLYSWAAREVVPIHRIGGTDYEIEKLRITSNSGEDRIRILDSHAEVLSLSVCIGNAFPDIPILGIDIVPEERTGRLYVLECNPGGNTWHFSSRATAAIRRQIGGGSLVGEKKAEEIGRRKLIEQFGAFDRAAEVLVRKVHELAR
jgi:hypothetical protein